MFSRYFMNLRNGQHYIDKNNQNSQHWFDRKKKYPALFKAMPLKSCFESPEDHPKDEERQANFHNLINFKMWLEIIFRNFQSLVFCNFVRHDGWKPSSPKPRISNLFPRIILQFSNIIFCKMKFASSYKNWNNFVKQKIIRYQRKRALLREATPRRRYSNNDVIPKLTPNVVRLLNFEIVDNI